MNFGTEVLNKGLSERERRENPLSKNYVFLKGESQFIVINVVISYCLLNGLGEIRYRSPHNAVD